MEWNFTSAQKIKTEIQQEMAKREVTLLVKRWLKKIIHKGVWSVYFKEHKYVQQTKLIFQIFNYNLREIVL